MERIETTAIRNLIHNEEYCRKVLPFIKEEYFADKLEGLLFAEIYRFVDKYNNLPTKESLSIEMNSNKSVNEDEYKKITDILSTLDKEPVNLEWLLETTEKFCKDRAIHNAILGGIQILDGKDKQHTPEYLPELLSGALSVSFDQKVGHDYLLESQERYDFYKKKEERLELDLDFFNKITRGGIPSKTLNICLAGTGVGKSLFMCHMASAGLMMNKNILYITLEMSEERIAERIDANVLNVPMKDLPDLSKKMYDKKVDKIRAKTKGKLIIKEYPTASAHVGHFRHLLQELEIKKDFKPDMIFIDYLNICSSHRIRPGSGANSYTLVKSIAEELRGLAVEFDVPIMSATQTTRSGYGSTDIGLEDTSESFGLPATADMMFALITSEELEELDQLVVKQLKNRYNDPTVFKRFVIGIDRSRMKLYDCEQDAQEELIDSDENETPVFDRNRGAEKFQDFNV